MISEVSAMLNIIFGYTDQVIYNTSAYFKNDFLPQWLSDPFVKEIIADVDRSEVISNGAIDSPVLGIIPPASLSGGTKALILIYEETGKIFNASNCGNNCAKWLLEIGRREDVTINLRHIMDFGDNTFDVHVVNDDIMVHDMDEMLTVGGRYV